MLYPAFEVSAQGFEGLLQEDFHGRADLIAILFGGVQSAARLRIGIAPAADGDEGNGATTAYTWLNTTPPALIWDEKPPLSKGTEAGASTFLSPYSIQSVLAVAFAGGGGEDAG